MPTTARGLPYPDATEPVAQGASAIQALAAAVDPLLSPRVVHGAVSMTAVIIAGTGFTVTQGGGGEVNVVFSSPFASPPIVHVTQLVNAADSVGVCGVYNLTAAGFRFSSNIGNYPDRGFMFTATALTGAGLLRELIEPDAELEPLPAPDDELEPEPRDE